MNYYDYYFVRNGEMLPFGVRVKPTHIPPEEASPQASICQPHLKGSAPSVLTNFSETNH